MQNNKDFTELLKYPEFDSQFGGIAGLLIGDALGTPYEFHPPEALPKRSEIDMVPPEWFNRSHAGVAPGSWSDDGSQALCLLASLLECGRFSLTDFSEKILRWFDEGYLAVDGDVFDVGIQTAEALHKLRAGVRPTESGGRGEYDNGNGSVMRVLPLTIWHAGSDEELVRDAHLQSIVTHAHPRSMVACGLICLVGRGYLNKLGDPWSWADQRLEELYEGWTNRREGNAFLTELNVLRDFPKTNEARGSGYILDTVWSARKALEEESFEDVVRTAILLGFDTDTTAAVAGGLAGIRYGASGIPQSWLKQLRGFDLVAPMIPDLLAKMKSKPFGVPSYSSPSTS